MSLITDTIDRLKELAAHHPAVIVAFSGGKDSLVVMSLAARIFSRVYPYFKHFIPGLHDHRAAIAAMEQHWPTIELLTYPHQTFINMAIQGQYCVPSPDWGDVDGVSSADVDEWVRQDTGADIILTGMKKSDFLNRRTRIARSPPNLIHPLADWHTFDVMAYLKANGITPPPPRRESFGINLSTPSILYLYEHYRDDYEKIRSYFPFIPAIVLRAGLHHGFNAADIGDSIPAREVRSDHDQSDRRQERPL